MVRRLILIPLAPIVALLLVTVVSAGLAWLQIQSDAGAFETGESLDAFIEGKMNEYNVPGVALVWIDGGASPRITGYSTRDGLTITPESRFQLASLSKPLTAWGVMALVQAGDLDLDTPVSAYLTRWTPPASDYDPDEITVRRLLSHTAGLSVSGYAGFEADSAPQTLDESLVAAADADDEAVAFALEPGTVWLYSGGGYSVLELLIEEVSGESFEDYMQGVIFDPLGMAGAGFARDLPSGLVPVFDEEDAEATPRTFAALAAGGIVATAEDLALWLLATLDPAESGVLSPETLAAMLTAQPATSTTTPLGEIAFGLGYRLETTSGDALVVSHDGNNAPGWRTHLSLVPQADAGLAVLTNHPGGAALHRDLTCAWINHTTGDVTYTCIFVGFWGMLPLVGGMALLFGGVIVLALGFYRRVARKQQKSQAALDG